MAESVQVTQDDIDNLATKLDAFAEVLSDREHALLRTVLGYARRAIEAEVGGSGAARPPLGAAFRKAVAAGVGGVFEIRDESDEEFIKIKFGKKDSPGETHREVHKIGPKREVHREVHQTKEGGGETEGEIELDAPKLPIP